MGLRGPLLDHLLLFPLVPSINQRIKTAERAGRGDKSTHVRSTRTVERKFSAALPVALCSLRLCYERFDQVLHGRFRERTRRTKSATAWPISWGLSSWRKWRPFTSLRSGSTRRDKVPAAGRPESNLDPH